MIGRGLTGTTAAAIAPAAALFPYQEVPLRCIILTLLTLAVWLTVQTAAASTLQVERIIRETFPADQARAVCVARHESGLDPAAQNGSNTGLFQIDQRTWDWRRRTGAGRAAVVRVVGRLDWSRMHDPVYNARAARLIWLRYGWSQWSTRKLCHG